MSPPTGPNGSASDRFDSGLNLSLRGLGVEYPPFSLPSDALEILANRHYPPSAALKKVLSINRFTGIDTRAAIGNVDHPLVNQQHAPNIKQLNDYFREEGVRLSVNACRKALREWGGGAEEITHVVSTTCTNSANPGFDHYVVKQLGIRSNVEKVLLHGIGCSGGMAAIRTAANLALGSSYRQKSARVLMLACEISSLLVRSELDSIDQDQETRVGVCLFSDCASAAILSNGIGEDEDSEPVYDILGWKHDIIDNTESDLGFDVDPLGWKVVLTPRVPSLASAAVPPCFDDLIGSLPELHDRGELPLATDFDWALHPGGSLIITGVQKAMNLPPELLRASYEIYVKYGNSSSATIISVMNRLRELGPGKEYVIACAFGPGIALEMMVLRRRNFDSAPMETETPMDNVVANGHHEGSINMQQNGNVNGSVKESATNGHQSIPNSIANSSSMSMLEDRAETNHLLSDHNVPAANGVQNGASSAASYGSESLMGENLPTEDLD